MMFLRSFSDELRKLAAKRGLRYLTFAKRKRMTKAEARREIDPEFYEPPPLREAVRIGRSEARKRDMVDPRPRPPRFAKGD